MANLERELSEEISRILSCPYPASLMKVAAILAQCNPQTIRKCVHDLAPCAILRLAKIVESALPLWAHPLAILQALCQSEVFAQQLLLQNPSLLNALLTKATSSHHHFEEYAELCVLLLSHPLPETVSLPASAQSFFLRVFERAARSPDIATLRPTYAMLNGACRGIISALSPQTRHTFDKELCQVLGSSSASQNSMLLLWCFGIVILVEHPDEAGRKFNPPSNSDGQVLDTTPDRQWKTSSGRKLFGSTNGLQKTINLTYLSVIWASKGDVGVSDDEAIEGIKIAIRTMQFVDREMREGWPNSSLLAQKTFPKLPAKIFREGINLEVQLQALCFYALIVGQNNMSADVIKQYEAALLNIARMQSDTNSLQELLAVSLPIFASRLHESTILRMLFDLLRLSQSIESPHVLCKLSILVQEFTAVVATSSHLRSQILAASSANELQETIQAFLKVPQCVIPESANCSGCSAAVTAARRPLQSSIVSLFLTAALTTASTDSRLTPDLTISLLYKQQQLCQAQDQCSHTISNAERSLSLFEQRCTPSTIQHQADWKECLKSELEIQSFYQRDSVIRSVAQICHDLESRCANAEKPLRQEQARVRELTDQVSRLAEQIQILETDAVDRQLYIDGLEDENETLQNEKDTLSSDLADLRIQFAEANRKAGEALCTAQEEFSVKELQARSIMLSHEENLHNRAMRIDDLVKNVGRLEKDIESLNDEKKSYNDLVKTLQAEGSALEHDLDTERRTVASHVQAIMRLEDAGRDLETQLRDIKRVLESVHDQRNDLQLQYQELMRSSEQTLQDMEAKHKVDMEAVTSKANDDHDRLHEELQGALQSSAEARNDYEQKQRDYQHAQTTIRTLQTKIQQLTDACSEKEHELHELRSLKSKMLAMMGIAAENALPPRSVRRPNHTEDSSKTPQHHRRCKSTIQSQENAVREVMEHQEITSTEMEKVARASFTSSDSPMNGSSPKRAKPRASFKIPAMHTPYGQKSELAPKALPPKRLSPSKRQALRAMSLNRRHTTVGFAAPENEEFEEADDYGNRKESLHDLKLASFDMEGLLTSTPFIPENIVSGTGKEPTEEEE